MASTASSSTAVTHVPVWNGVATGPVTAWVKKTLTAFRADKNKGHNHLYERTNPISYHAATNGGTSSVQAVSTSAEDAAVVYPAKDGTTYVVVGSGGRPRYAWSGAVEADRNFLVGVDTGKPGNGVDVGADAKTEVGPYVSQKDFTDQYESIDWSQARYRDYAFIALDVVPAKPGETSSMTLRAINERGVEFDRVVFKRSVRH